MDTSLNSTNLQGYDMVVAVTQNSVNGNFKFLFGRPDGIHRTITLRIDNEDAEIKGSIRPPYVSLRGANSPRKVIFCIDIEQGTLDYWSGHGPTSVKHQRPIEKWTIGFLVNLSMAEAEERHVPDAVMQQVRNLGAGALSVRQLFMDLQTADIATWDPGTTVLPDEIRNDPAAAAFFALLMQQYMVQLRQDGHHILGYGIRVANPNASDALPPTSPPTDLDFVINRYVPPNGGTDDPGLDTLCYLMMADHRPLPAGAPGSFGNWAGSRDEFGCIAQSQRTFLDGFLLPHLASTINLVTEFKPEGDTSVSAQCTAGHPFTERTPFGARYLSYSHLERERLIPGGTTRYTYFASHATWVEAPGGGTAIEIKGTSVLRMDLVHWWGIPEHAAQTPMAMGVQMNWRVPVSLLGIVDGALEVHVGDVEVSRDDIRQLDWLGKLGEILVPGFKEGIDKVCGQFAGAVASIVDPNALRATIDEVLNARSAFVFPGGRDLRLFSPRISTNHGDLVANLRWEQG